MKKRDVKYLIILPILLFFTIFCFVSGMRDLIEYNNTVENAVTVAATVESTHLHYREETHRNAGAGDNIDKEIALVPYFTYSISYTFEGKEYRCGYDGRSHIGEMIEGEQIEIVIDSNNPEQMITDKNNGEGALICACWFLLFFVVVLFIWIIKSRGNFKAWFNIFKKKRENKPLQSRIAADGNKAVRLKNDGTAQNRIAAADKYAVGLKSDGTVMTTNFAGTGFGYFGQCEVDDWKDIVAVSAGSCRTMGVKSNGTLVWTGRACVPEEVSQWTDIVAVSSKDSGVIGLRSDGTVVAAGKDIFGKYDVSGWSDIVAISEGDAWTVGLRNDGTLMYAGTQEPFIQGDILSWKEIVAVSAGICHTVGLRSNGTVVTTAANNRGQSNVKKWRKIVAVAAGMCHTVGLRSDGTVKVAGYSRDAEKAVSYWRNIVAVFAAGDYTIGLRDDGTVVSVNEPGMLWNDLKKWNVLKNKGGRDKDTIPYIVYNNGEDGTMAD